MLNILIDHSVPFLTQLHHNLFFFRNMEYGWESNPLVALLLGLGLPVLVAAVVLPALILYRHFHFKNRILRFRERMIELSYNSDNPLPHDQSSCVICRENFENDQLLFSLSCGHTFHQNCMTTYLRYDEVCMLCRVRI